MRPCPRNPRKDDKATVKTVAWLVCLGAGIFALFACGEDVPRGSGPGNTAAASAPASEPAKPLVVVSIYPVASIVDQLAGDWLEIYTLIPPDGLSTSRKLSDYSRKKLSQAQVLFTVSPEYDGWIEAEAKEVSRKDLKLLRFSDIVGLTGAGARTKPATEPDTRDAQALWLDPALVDYFIQQLGDRLSPLVMEHATSLRTRAKLMRTRLIAIDVEFAAKFRESEQRKLVVYDPSFDGLMRKYGLEVVGHVKSSIADDTPALDAQELAHVIEEHHLPVVYGYARRNDPTLDAVIRHTGVKLIALDPMGGEGISGYDNYLDMLKSNLEKLEYGQARPTKKQSDDDF